MANPLQIIFLLIQEELAFPLFLAYLIWRAFLFCISNTNPLQSERLPQKLVRVVVGIDCPKSPHKMGGFVESTFTENREYINNKVLYEKNH